MDDLPLPRLPMMHKTELGRMVVGSQGSTTRFFNWREEDDMFIFENVFLLFFSLNLTKYSGWWS